MTTHDNDALAAPGPERAIYSNRTLNLRSIRAIGYDMDYTLIHYHTQAWEARAYDYVRQKLADRGWPVEDLSYQPNFISRGIVVDIERGNLLKANRFGYVKQASHGTRALRFEEMRTVYSRTLVKINDPRYKFLNTLFSLSEACMFAQLVDKLDAGELREGLGYEELYRTVNRALDESHAEGELKAEILADPAAYISHDPDTTLALLDQRLAGRKIILITNSDWDYTNKVMTTEFDPELPDGMTWRDLFDLVIVSSRKPSFFDSANPAFEVVDESRGLLTPAHRNGLQEGKVYVGGNARLVEDLWHLQGEQILFVGDHLYADVEVSKNLLRWRTALILRELEDEISALAEFKETQAQLARMMADKERVEQTYHRSRLRILRGEESRAIRQERDELQQKLQELDASIGPLAKESGELMNPHWGLVMRAGNDKSLLARQVENFADIYLSRVSNFLYATPFAYLRSRRSTLPHDQFESSLSDSGESN